MMKVRFVHEYYHNLVGAIDKSGIFLDRSSLGRGTTLDSGQAQIGRILAPLSGAMADPTAQPYDPSNGLVLHNGAFLNVRETVRVARDGTGGWLDYSYHYQDPRGGYYFRFEKDSTPDPNPIWKPQVHFHTSGRPKIHFPSVEMDLFRLIDFLIPQGQRRTLADVAQSVRLHFVKRKLAVCVMRRFLSWLS